MVEQLIEKNTASYAVVNILALRMALIPSVCKVLFILEVKTLYVTVTINVVVVISIDESLVY